MPQAAGELLCRLRKHCEKVSWTGGGEHAAQVLSSAPRAAATTGANGVTAHSSGASRCRRERPARTSASYRNGALEAIVPKAAQRAEPRQIPVSVVNAKNANTALTTSPGSA